MLGSWRLCRRKKLLGRAKSCRWQVFVRRRPPKQGELRTDVSKATMFQGDKGGGKARGACRPGRDKLSTRTCKKLPVASFCASETAETGRIANGREQGDHVSRSRLRPATSIQISARYEISVEMTGGHHVTGCAEDCRLPGYRR